MSTRPRSSTVTAVSAATSSTQLFGSTYPSRGRSVFNDSTATLYLKFGSSAATNSYSVQIPPASYFEFPGEVPYAGVVTGVWSAASGTAYCTEVS